MRGDDVVIADLHVARQYEDYLHRLGVTISYPKSLISSTGAAEFAKRFRVRNMRKDLSPLSIRNLLGSHHPYGLMGIDNTYKIKRFSTLARIGESHITCNIPFREIPLSFSSHLNVATAPHSLR
jgi:hypothetical protein